MDHSCSSGDHGGGGDKILVVLLSRDGELGSLQMLWKCSSISFTFWIQKYAEGQRKCPQGKNITQPDVDRIWFEVDAMKYSTDLPNTKCLQEINAKINYQGFEVLWPWRPKDTLVCSGWLLWHPLQLFPQFLCKLKAMFRFRSYTGASFAFPKHISPFESIKPHILVTPFVEKSLLISDLGLVLIHFLKWSREISTFSTPILMP